MTQPDGRGSKLRLKAGACRWRRLAAGLVLMALGAVAAGAALDRSDDRSGYVAAARDLPAGRLLESGDLQVVHIAGADALSAVPVEERDGLVGQRLSTAVPERSLIPSGAVTAEPAHLEDGEAVIGAVLSPAQFPASLQEGAQVSAIISEHGDGEGDAETTGVPARVQAIHASTGDGSESTRVELVVDAADAARVAQAAAAEALSVVEVGGGVP
ncbi:SAF domain-containing protein [Nocardiopsis sp. RSe5-2]|uniref:SAF domain-containing protein n=1 Tax=Nocardiopsis endophytica TaxID=3018445 RepID=A0ABT4TZ01_9ACTN|nr:SAF domain-containing protein [Nocardiopsis endophytica]MDA2809923.1 SAF domain-containing protein [Nocardiopsis endophytica]